MIYCGATGQTFLDFGPCQAESYSGLATADENLLPLKIVFVVVVVGVYVSLPESSYHHYFKKEFSGHPVVTQEINFQYHLPAAV